MASSTTAVSGYDRTVEVKKFDDSKLGVKGLSESGITSIPRIFVQPPEILSTLKSSQTPKEIPVIDLAIANSNDRRSEIVEKIRKASSEWGFFQVINHGIHLSVLDETIAAIKSFHEQPQEVRSKHYARSEEHGVMYASNNDLFRAKAASWHDYVQVWMSPKPVNVNLIPDKCRQEVVEWNGHATKVAETLMELLCEGLGLAAGKFKELGFTDARVVVGAYYPYCPQPDLTVGLTPHTDPGALTVLLPNQVPGLQVKHVDEWVAVKPLEGALVVNIGDFLQIISNGEYKSVQHRVMANPLKEPRISVVEFFNVYKDDPGTVYGPLPELLSPEKPAIYRNFTLQEFNETFFTKGLDSKRIVEKVKL